MGNENTESGQVAGAAGQPSQQASQTSGSSTSSVDVETLKGILRPIIAEEVTRAQQSTKDKRIAKLSGEVAGVKNILSRLEELMSDGFSQKQAIRFLEMEERQQLATIDNQGNETEVPLKGVTGTQTQAAGVDTATLVKAVGLDANSPEVLAAIRDHQDNLFEQYAAITNLAVKKQAAQQTPPNSAQIMSAGGGQPVPPTTTDSLMAEYQNLTKNIPPGEEGVKPRLDAKIAIRKKAAAAQLQSPV